MRVPKVRLYIRIRDEHGKSIFADPAWNRNKTLRAGHAVIGGRTAACADGVYYLRYLKNGKRIWTSVGGSPDAAITALRNTEREFQARSLGFATVPDCEFTLRTSNQYPASFLRGGFWLANFLRSLLIACHTVVGKVVG